MSYLKSPQGGRLVKTKRIAIVSDIHANIYALNAFLEYLKKHFQVTDILNLGDFLQIGPYPREVTEIIFSDKRFINILGNNELSLLDRNPSSFPEDEYAHQDWTIKQIGPELMGKLSQISKSNILSINEKKLLMIHSRPYNTIEMPLLYQGKPLDDFTKDYDSMDVDYVLFGHTHLQAYINYWVRKTFINPGSLGCSKESIMSFCLAEIDSQDISFSFKNIHYDNSKLKDDYIRLGVPAAKRILSLFYGIEI